MAVYKVVFQDGRIGRDHNVGPATISADGYGPLAEAVYDIARPHLGSRYPEVVIDQRDDEDQPVGIVFAGFHTVAKFTIEEVAA